MALTRPLQVALTALVLLLIVLGGDAAMNRSYAVDLQESDGAWRTLARHDEAEPQGFAREFPFGVGTTLNVSRNETLDFRLRVENGYIWSYSPGYVVYVGGVEVARGPLEVAARSDAVVAFSIDVERLVQSFPKPVAAEEPTVQYTSFHVQIGREPSLFVNLPMVVRE